jgi:hypothetical protein
MCQIVAPAVAGEVSWCVSVLAQRIISVASLLNFCKGTEGRCFFMSSFSQHPGHEHECKESAIEAMAV